MRSAGHGRPGGRIACALAVALLGAGVCAACQPRIGEFEVTNSTDETLLLWDEPLTPGTTREFELEASSCEDLVLFSEDAAYRVTVSDVCDDDHVDITPEDLRPAQAVTVVNATTEPLELAELGWSDIRTTPLGPGEELRIPLTPDEAYCVDGVHEDPELVVVRPGQPDGGGVVVARHWDEVCGDTRWVLDDAELAAAAPATVAVTNTTGMTLRVWPADLAGDTWTTSAEVLPDATVELQLAFQVGACESAPIGVEVRGSSEEIRVRDDLSAPCDGELVLTRADFVHLTADYGWVPLDPDGEPSQP